MGLLISCLNGSLLEEEQYLASHACGVGNGLEGTRENDSREPDVTHDRADPVQGLPCVCKRFVLAVIFSFQ